MSFWQAPIALVIIFVAATLQTCQGWSPTFRSQRPNNRHEFNDLNGWLDEMISTQSKSLQMQKQQQQKKKKKRDSVEKTAKQVADVPTTPPATESLLKRTWRKFRTVLLVNVVRVVVKLHWEGHVLKYLPDRILMDIVKRCLAKDARAHVLCVVSAEVDRRVSKFRDNYEFGDLTRSAIYKFTGRKQYQFGDITRTVLERAREKHPLNESVQRELKRFNQNKTMKKRQHAIVGQWRGRATR